MKAFSLSLQLDKIDQTLDALVAVPEGPYKTVFEAARYTLLSPGKRLRPLLTIATAETFGAPPSTALIPGCAIEILHTYSLIHDDLPCMDNDDLRRGKPTLHTVYPEAQALLAGDLLLTLAFEVLATSPDLSPSQILSMIQVLAKQSGGMGLIGGQSLDLLSEGKEISWDTLQAIHLGKTACLISACLEIGAIVADASTHIRKTLAELGLKIGLCFQIIDDVLDVEGKPELLGKPLLSDEEKQKSTSVSILGAAHAKAFAESLLSSCLEICKELGIEDSPLAKLLPKLVYREF